MENTLQTNNENKQEFSKILPPWKFILLSISTFGIYELVWLYKYWKILKKAKWLNISPFWRTFFSTFFVWSFARHLQIYLREKDIPCNYSPTLIGGSYFILILLCKLPDPYWMIAFLTFIPMLPLLNGINQFWKKQEQDLPPRKFAWWQIILIIIGLLFFMLSLIGTFFPE